MSKARDLADFMSVTNVFTDADETKLDGIATGATNVTNNNQLTNGAGFTTNTVVNGLVDDIETLSLAGL